MPLLYRKKSPLSTPGYGKQKQALFLERAWGSIKFIQVYVDLLLINEREDGNVEVHRLVVFRAHHQGVGNGVVVPAGTADVVLIHHTVTVRYGNEGGEQEQHRQGKQKKLLFVKFDGEDKSP